MALEVATPYASGSAPVSFSTANADVTGASGSFTTVVTGGTGGSLVSGIAVRAVTNTRSGTILYIFHNSGGTRRNVGHIVVTPNIRPDGSTGCWEGTWTNPLGANPLKSGDKYDIAPYSGTTTYVAYAIGGDY